MKFASLLLAVLLCSCASTYKPIRPDAASYQTPPSADQGLQFSYKLSVLRENGNKKYAKREDRRNIRLASVKLTNTLDRPLIIGKDIIFKSGANSAALLTPEQLHKQLKQGVAEYLLYLLLTPLQFYNEDNRTPIGLVIGPGLAIGNMVGAGGANQNFLKELRRFSVIDKPIAPGETVFGIIGYYDVGFNPLSIIVSK